MLHGSRIVPRVTQATPDPPTTSGERERPNWRAVLPYLLAATIYISLGVSNPRFMLSWVQGITFLVLAVWALPAIIRRFRR